MLKDNRDIQLLFILKIDHSWQKEQTSPNQLSLFWIFAGGTLNLLWGIKGTDRLLCNSCMEEIYSLGTVVA